MILLDTDVLLDVALDRRPHVEDSGRLLSFLERRPRVCGASYIATRNVKDFRGSPIPARIPADILVEFA